MDPTTLLVVLILVVLFAGISVVGVLRRIAAATEKTAKLLADRAQNLPETTRDES